MNIRASILDSGLISLYVLFLLFPAMINQGPLLQTDQPMWTAVTHVTVTEVVPDQKWFWGIVTDQASAGLVLGRLYSAPIILPWLIAQVTSPATAVKLAMLFSLALFSVAFYAVARLYLPRRYAVASTAVVISPMFDNVVSGMWYNYLSLGFGLLFWLCCDAFVMRRRRFAIPAAAVLFALSIYGHPVGSVLCQAILCAYGLMLVLTRREFWIRQLGLLAGAAVVGLLLAYPQIHTLANVGQVVPVSTTPTVSLGVTGFTEVIRRLSFIRVWGAMGSSAVSTSVMIFNIGSVLVLSAFGFFALAGKRQPERVFPIGMVMISAALLISRIYNLVPLPYDAVGTLSHYSDRFQLFTQVYLTLLAGIGLHRLWSMRSGMRRSKRLVTVAVVVLTIGFLGIAARTPKKIFIDRTEQLGTLGTSTIGEQTTELWAWLSANTDPEKERVYFEDTLGNLCWNGSATPENRKTHLLALTNEYTSIRQIGGWGPFSGEFSSLHERGTMFGKKVRDTSFTDEFIREELQLLNCRFAIVYSEAARKRLGESMAVREAVIIGPYHVFEALEPFPAWAWNTRTNDPMPLLKRSPSHFSLTADGLPGDTVQISLAHSPGWRATSVDTDLPIRSHRAMMQIVLGRPGVQVIDLKYRIDKKFPTTFFFLGVACLVILCAVALVWTFPASAAVCRCSPGGRRPGAGR